MRFSVLHPHIRYDPNVLHPLSKNNVNLPPYLRICLFNRSHRQPLVQIQYGTMLSTQSAVPLLVPRPRGTVFLKSSCLNATTTSTISVLRTSYLCCLRFSTLMLQPGRCSQRSCQYLPYSNRSVQRSRTIHTHSATPQPQVDVASLSITRLNDDLCRAEHQGVQRSFVHKIFSYLFMSQVELSEHLHTMHLFVLALLFLRTLGGPPPSAIASNGDDANGNWDWPIARTQQGVAHGVHVNDAVSAFRGIPFAEPPVGDLRFRPPIPLPNKGSNCDDVIDASKFGPVCNQFHYKTVMLNNTIETTPQSEDCLTLNIFVPRSGKDGETLPILVWQYGGAFTEGGGSMPC